MTRLEDQVKDSINESEQWTVVSSNTLDFRFQSFGTDGERGGGMVVSETRFEEWRFHCNEQWRIGGAWNFEEHRRIHPKVPGHIR